MSAPTSGDRSANVLAPEDRAAFEELVRQYYPRLRKLARKHIGVSSDLRAQVGSEDIIQVVFEKCLRAVLSGKVALSDVRLDGLLVTITLFTVWNAKRAHSRQKREPACEWAFPARGLPPDLEAAYIEELDRLHEELGDGLFLILRLKLEGWSQTKIAKKVGVSDATITRRMELIESHFQQLFQRPSD